eukprot:SM000084S23145  [mRNA]  locus=s84:314838:315329:- [translate_table: standard]
MAMEEEVGRRAEVMEVAEVDLEEEMRGTQGGVVEEEVVEVGGQPKDCDEEGERPKVMALAELAGEDWRLEVMEVAVKEEVGRRAEVMEVAEVDLEVVERGTLGVVEEEVVGLGVQPEDCEGEGERLEVMALTEVGGVVVRES